jgi:hypothetical protein
LTRCAALISHESGQPCGKTFTITGKLGDKSAGKLVGFHDQNGQIPTQFKKISIFWGDQKETPEPWLVRAYSETGMRRQPAAI